MTRLSSLAFAILLMTASLSAPLYIAAAQDGEQHELINGVI